MGMISKILSGFPFKRTAIRELKPHVVTQGGDKGNSMIIRACLDEKWLDVFLTINDRNNAKPLNIAETQQILRREVLGLPGSMALSVVSDQTVRSRFLSFGVNAFWQAIEPASKKYQVFHVTEGRSFYLSAGEAGFQHYPFVGLRILDPYDPNSVDLNRDLIARLIYRATDFYTEEENTRKTFEWYHTIAVSDREIKDCVEGITGKIHGICVIEDDLGLLSLQKDQLLFALQGIDRKIDLIDLDLANIRTSQEFPVYTASNETGFSKIVEIAKSDRPFLFFMGGSLGYKRYITGETLTADIRRKAFVQHIIAAMSDNRNNNYDMLCAGADFVIQRREFTRLFPLLFLY